MSYGSVNHTEKARGSKNVQAINIINEQMLQFGKANGSIRAKEERTRSLAIRESRQHNFLMATTGK